MKIVWSRSIGWNIEYNRARMSYNGAAKFNPSPGKKYMELTIIKDGAGCYPWKKTVVMWPRRSITGQWLWMTVAYKRRIWCVWGTGFHMEPEVEYATIMEILADKRLNECT